MSEAITIHHLSKSFGQHQALTDVSLGVEVGQVYGFLGPNGAGKTTTIRCLLGFLRPTGGALIVMGHDVSQDLVAAKRQLGYMAADNHLYPQWNGAQHLGLMRRMWGELPLADDLIRRLDIDMKVPSRHLSTGNHQKLGLLVAMAHQPKLLILDEPTRGLDPLLQHEIEHILAEFCQTGGTVFISSHNLSEVERLCDQVGIIKNGQMVASQSMADLRTMKVHMVTAIVAKQPAAEKLSLPKVTVVQAEGQHLILKVHGDLHSTLQVLAELELEDLEVSHVPLEEVFMEYYR